LFIILLYSRASGSFSSSFSLSSIVFSRFSSTFAFFFLSALLPNLASATTAELLDVTGKKGGFTDGFGVYRKAGGGVNTSSTRAIQLAKCIETCTAYGYVEVFTGLTSSAVTLSIGTPTQNQVLLGSRHYVI
jgi:hypothetical protein